MEDRIKKVQTEQEKRFVRGKILVMFDRCVELSPDKKIAEHMWTILRPHNDNPYYWSDDKLLGKIESYFKQLSEIVEDEE